MTGLNRSGLVTVIARPRGEPGGKPLSIYTLSTEGAKKIKAKARPPSKSVDRLTHTLEANDFLILFHEYARATGASVTHDLTEAETRQRQRAYTPDGAVMLQCSDTESGFLLELDRGHEERLAWQAKLGNAVEFFRGEYQHYLPSESLTILTLLTDEEPEQFKRLVQWSRAVIPSALWNNFLFASFQPDQVDPVEVFERPIWVSASSSVSSLVQRRP